MDSNILPIISSVLGWSYVLTWSISLYPPILLNRRLKSVEGISLDFMVLNFIGYVMYTLSVWMLYSNQWVRNEYAQRHTLVSDTGELNYPLVRFNDIVYGLHGVVLLIYMFLQMFCMGYATTSRQRHLSRYTKLLLGGVIVAGVAGCMYAYRVQDTPQHFELYDLVWAMGNVKVAMSTAKYVPQVLYNHHRRSTKGWSMSGVRLDLFGAAASLAQLFLDGYIRHDLSGVWNNTVKLALAVVTVFFDTIFLTQHFIYKEDDGGELVDLRNLS
ncbi:cystine transporter [Trichomonascus vanleenenianus]|uniref:cystinosin-like protein ERS1 n=1 Tax=Trichomonascus vanleenenianus TaxID=2268995 RepID=UPI003ECB93C1